MIPDPDGAVNINSTVKQILESLSKMTEVNKKQYIADVKVMNYLLQAIPNDIYNSVDACKNTKEMWEQINRLMFGSNVTSHVRLSHLMNEFDKFIAKEEELLESVYERLTTLVNIMDRNNFHPISVSINTKFLNCLQPEWSKYVTMDGRVDIHTKNAGYCGNGNKNAGRQSKNQTFNAGNRNDNSNQIIQPVPRTESTPDEANVQCYNCNEKGHYARDFQKLRSCSRIQPVDGNAETVPLYDAKVVSEVNASSKVHEQMHHENRKTIIQTSDDDQIDSNIIFYDPHVENNSGTSDHDSNDHDEYHKIQMLAYDVQREADNCHTS
nr:hypothetical protein [Tanacetum cinerariifolium]